MALLRKLKYFDNIFVRHLFVSCIHENAARVSVRKAFQPLVMCLNKESKQFQENVAYNKMLHERFSEASKVAEAGGGPVAIERHVKKNKKLLAMDRLKKMLDDGEDFLELSKLAGSRMAYGNVPRAGVITGIGKVQGIQCMFLVNDASVKGGALFPISVKKNIRAMEIALQNNIPCIYIVDSGGAFLPLQADIFPDKDHGGRAFYLEAILNSHDVPQLSIVCGSCTAGGAYVPTMTQEAVITHKIGTIFLGGPPLVYAALGEVVSSESLGGATMHCSISGCTDHFAATEEEAYQIGRGVVATFNIPEAEEPSGYEEPLYDKDELLGIIPEREQHNMDAHKVIAHIVDGSRFQEFKAMYGPSLVTGFCYIQGYLVGILANNGEITSQAAWKGSHFVQLCCQRKIPLVFLQNTAPDNCNAETVEQGQFYGERLRAHASFMAAVAVAPVPKITIITGNSFGSTNYLMGGRCMSPNFIFSWPNSKIAITEPEKLRQDIIKSHFLDGIKEESEQFQIFASTVLEPLTLQTSSLYASSQVWDDGVILPQETRAVLGHCLKIVNQCPKTKETDYPFLRM